MKKLFFVSAVVLGSIGLYSCDGGGATSEEGTVVDRDTTVSELEVERTTMDIDTSMNTETETIELENEEQ
ncbi:hypothetical protein ACFS7Z_20430 [Pontibacter toksunensis]|uniref:Uncharacterized protein n=1 Tax=Pontibacter toksunensis TaxID=1332631 RepID=A0ABW6BY76_9BACT